MNNNESSTGEIVMYQPDETIRLEVRVEDETVWLTQQQMAELFKATKQNISLHINNIYDEGELERIATVKDYLTVQKEGKRMVNRHVNLYNLDVIISVGYRVKSKFFRPLIPPSSRRHLLRRTDLRCQLKRCRQKTLCLHQDARNTSSNSAERYTIYFIDYGYVVMTDIGLIKPYFGLSGALFLCPIFSCHYHAIHPHYLI